MTREEYEKELKYVVNGDQEPCEDAISRAEAIKAMDDLEQEDIELYGCPIPEGFDGRRAIEALQKLPSVTPIIAECEDAISRQAVMDFIRGLTRWCVRSEDGKFNNVGLLYDDVMFGLDRLPSVTPKQKIGRWIPVSERLPEESINSVIGWDAYRERCVFVQYIGGHFQITGKSESFDIIAWMPLPEPYKAESED